MSGRLLLFWALLLAVGLVACEDNDGYPSGDPVSFAAFCDRYAAMTCKVAERCRCLEGIPVSYCEIYQRGDCADWVEEPVNAGRMAYHDGPAGDCLAALEHIIGDCSLDDADWPSACDEMLTGRVAEGQYCDGDAECLSGLECWDDVCVRMPVAGQPCYQGDYCAEDHYCGVDGLCHRYQGLGGPCPEGDYACADDLYCDSRTTSCQPYVTRGGDCAHDDYACDDGLYCSDAAGQTCQPYPTAGQSCFDSGDYCAGDNYCDESDVCQPQRPAGQACTDDEQCLSWECTDQGLCEADTEDVCPF